MSTNTIDSGAFPGLGIRADRKTPAPWALDGRPDEPMLGAAVWRPTSKRPTTASLRVVREAAGPGTAWASPPPLVTKRAMQLFQLGLAAMVLVSVFVL